MYQFFYRTAPVWQVLFILSATLLFFGMNSGMAQQSTAPNIAPPGSRPYGLSYEDHVTNFWKLMLSLPIENNPLEDETGEICTYGQNTSNSSIFYLTANAGGVSEKTCRIPSGLGLFIPVITVTASDEENPGATLDELRQIAKNDQDHVTSLYLTINGTEFEFEDLKGFRTHTNEFEVIYPKNALDGATPGPATVVADGFYVITEPLAPGNYNIQFKGSIVCLAVDCIEPTFATDNKFNLIVE
jgi:hypothetical protein